jgi:hypothetical protein
MRRELYPLATIHVKMFFKRLERRVSCISPRILSTTSNFLSNCWLYKLFAGLARRTPGSEGLLWVLFSEHAEIFFSPNISLQIEALPH